MKNGKITTAFAFVLAGFIGAGGTLLLTNSCDLFGSSGGSGADFDSSLYYTKAEVNALLADVFRGTPSDSYQQLLNVAYAGRAPDGWTVPDGFTAGLFEVNVAAIPPGTSDGAINIIVSSADSLDAPDIQFTASTTGYSTALFTAPNLTAGSVVYAWHTTGHGGASNLTYHTVAVRCRGWLK
ncbi:MAG: hypothetical protein WCT14_12815 [Treponemataceae bacterium]